MNHAFIFDMDGVIVDSERTWALYEHEFHERLFGKDIAKKLPEMVGLSLPGIYEIATQHGFTKKEEDFYAVYDEQAQIIYQQAIITKGLEALIIKLKAGGFKIGLVSASPQKWIELVLEKAKLKNKFDYILSLHERDDLDHKPQPDGFLEAMKQFQTTPQHTIILEDSNRGIQSAKASGAFTIGFRQHLLSQYQQTGADAYADSMEDVIKIVEKNLQEKSL